VFPALAVAEAMRSEHTVGLLYLGKQGGIEERLAQAAKIEFYGLPLRGLKRAWHAGNFLAAGEFAAGFFRARRMLRERRISALLATGGFAAAPYLAAALSLGLPTLLHESNVVPGLVNRVFGRCGAHAALSFEQSRRYFPAGRAWVSGFPVRARIGAISKELGCAAFGLDPERPVILVFPGSLAASSINAALVRAWPEMRRELGNVQWLWMAGAKEAAAVGRLAVEQGMAAKVLPFIDAVPEALGAADLVIARAGAGTVAELSQAGVPCVLVPYPHAAHRHQDENARVLASRGLAKVLKESALERGLAPAVVSVWRERLAMRGAWSAEAAGTSGAAQRLAHWLWEHSEKHLGKRRER
jgi:UDP-N-acetylglucosamine--N-acetylmuramyl-(pentapeptide) pyrophosphoryl-undecaprenol N-acetylglucosamine transferase